MILLIKLSSDNELERENSENTHFHRAGGAATAEGKGENLSKNLSETTSVAFVALQLQHDPQSKIWHRPKHLQQ